MECIFCKIIKKEIDAKILLETDKSVAFLDAFPLAEGHSLVIPKKHFEKIQSMDSEYILDLFETVQKITSKVEISKNSSLIAIHNGKDSGQEIPHLHVHIIPRRPEDGAGPVHVMFKHRPTFSNDEMNEIYRKLKI